MKNKDLEFTIRRGIFDNAPRKLILNPEFIKFQSNDSVDNPYTIFEVNEIAELRFGMKWISIEVTFGREYFIYIRNTEKKIIKINFSTYFGNKKTEYQNLYREIIINLENLYFGKIVEEYLKKYQRKESFQINDVYFSEENVKIGGNGIIKGSEKIISWENLRIKDYYSNITIYSAENSKEINRGFSYLEDWNSLVLCSFLKSVLKYRESEKKKVNDKNNC
ncbi:hypothetical protein [uncultured Flavobacterium sp.]|uniref:hypothetical protein n=1 Tax=uncultured Flavobacterium sp. TaxID=165435 RepID=UPI0030EF460F|tara:strand:+ start:1180 stop:1842 length:663 start_codon:yes stop_codon:yes gene_type:complete